LTAHVSLFALRQLFDFRVLGLLFAFDILFFIMYTIYVFKIKQDDEKVNTDFAFSSSCIILSLYFCAL